MVSALPRGGTICPTMHTDTFVHSCAGYLEVEISKPIPLVEDEAQIPSVPHSHLRLVVDNTVRP
jgi:hypothetical protein